MATVPFKTHEDFVAQLDEYVEQGKIRVGDIVLWGFEQSMLHSVLLNDVFPSHTQLPALIAYTTVDTGRVWAQSVTHTAMVVRIDPEKKGAASIVTIESATDRHTGYSGLMEHPLLYYCDPEAPRSMKILRFNSSPEEMGKPLRKTYCDLLDKVIHKAPFLISKQPYKSWWQRVKDAANRATISFWGLGVQDDAQEPHLPKDGEVLKIGLGYNQYQLLQYAVAVANANNGDAAFDELRWMLDAANNGVVTSFLAGHKRGSFFCSQAIAEIAYAVQQSIEQEPDIPDEIAAKSPFNIVFPSTLFEQIKNRIKAGISIPPVDIVEVSIDPLDEAYFNAVGVRDFDVVVPPEHRGEVIRFAEDPMEYIMNKVSDSVLKQFRIDLNKQIQEKCQIDEDSISEILTAVKNHNIPQGTPAKDILSQKMVILAEMLIQKMNEQGIDPELVDQVNVQFIHDEIVLGAVRTGTLTHPSLPEQVVLDKHNTNVFGYVSPCDFEKKDSDHVMIVFEF